jgi:hypothetical protein
MGKDAYPFQAMAEECLSSGGVTDPQPGEEFA